MYNGKPLMISSVEVESVPRPFLAVQLYVPESFPDKAVSVSTENESD